MNLDQDQWNQLVALGAHYGLQVLRAAIVLGLGWLLAKGLSIAAKKVLDRTKLDNRLANYLTGGRADGIPVEAGVAKFVYWLVMLVALMAAFQVLDLTVVSEPIRTLVNRLVAFLPQILAAGLLLAGAWIVATLLRMIVRNLLSAFQLDRKVGEHAGEEAGAMPLAAILADGVYYLIFLLFLPQILDALQMEGLSPVKDMVAQILAFLPKLFGAVVLFFVFYLVARVVQRLVVNLLAGFGFDRLPHALGFEGPREGQTSASTIAGYVVVTILLFIGAVQAFKTLGLEIVSNLAEELLAGLFNVLVACVIFALGLFLSQLAHRTIASGSAGQATLLAGVARAAILVFTGAMALFRAGLAKEIVTLAFGALIVGLALAGGLAFGLGGRDEAARTIARWREKSS